MDQRRYEPTVPGLKPERLGVAALPASDPEPVRLADGLIDVRQITDEPQLLKAPLLDLGIKAPPSDLGTGLWTVGDAFQGLQVFGSTGSGKSTGSGLAVAKAFLRSGFGGLVLCAKADEPGVWQRYVRDYGIGQRLIEFSPSPGCCFNFLDYEYKREGGGLTHDIVSLFLSAISSGQGAHSTVDPYWGEALREMLTHAVDLVAEGTKSEPGTATLSLHDLLRVVRSAPQNRREAASAAWKHESDCWKLMEKADRLVVADRLHPDPDRNRARARDMADTFEYWRNDFPTLTDRVRSIIVSSFTSKVHGLLRSPLRELFCDTAKKEYFPERSFEGDIILLNLPLKEFGEVGRFAQVLYKTIWQRAAERRVKLFTRAKRGDPLSVEERLQMRPVFLWADESQYFISSEDARFQQTARAARTATVFLTQNLPNYYSMLSDRHATAATDSLVGNLQTKILHANGDPTTNEWAERLFGKHWISMPTRSTTTSDSRGAVGGATFGESKQISVGWHYSPVVEGRLFSTLSTGGEQHGHKIRAYLYQAGRPRAVDADGKPLNALSVLFKQELAP